MAHVQCQCKQRIKISPEQYGRRLACPKCNTAFTVPPPEDPAQSKTDSDIFTFVDDEQSMQAVHSNNSSHCEHCAVPMATSAVLCVRCGYNRSTGRQTTPRDIDDVNTSLENELAPVGGIGEYFKDCARASLFIADAGNLITFIFVAILAAINAVVDMFSYLLIMFIIGTLFKGLLAAFFFNTVVNAASGENDLPDIGLSGDLWDDTIAPAINLLATSAIVALPTIVYLFAVGISSATETGLALTIGIGVFFWPITVLVIALGGISCFARPGQILLTIARTFVPYLVTCLVLTAAFGFTAALQFSLDSAAVKLGANKWAIATILWIANVYCLVVAMQCIGLYYHHFKKRFAWSWG